VRHPPEVIWRWKWVDPMVRGAVREPGRRRVASLLLLREEEEEGLVLVPAPEQMLFGVLAPVRGPATLDCRRIRPWLGLEPRLALE
jgi:hypothetical protein